MKHITGADQPWYPVVGRNHRAMSREGDMHNVYANHMLRAKHWSRFPEFLGRAEYFDAGYSRTGRALSPAVRNNMCLHMR
jgi:hypothetical protein